MKTVLKRVLMVFVASFMLLITSSFESFKVIEFEDLPLAAKMLVQHKYPHSSVKSICFEFVLFHRIFKLRLDDGTEVEFDEEGEWLDILSGDEAVLTDFVPCAILSRARQDFPNVRISEIVHDDVGYSLILSNGVVLMFDEDYQMQELLQT